MQKINYQREFEKTLEGLQGRPSLLLHACCGPCSSFVLKCLEEYFDLSVFFYNPCVFPAEEYELRRREQLALIRQMNEEGSKIGFIEGRYEHSEFLREVRGLEDEPEGGRRCRLCFRQRLFETAREAKDRGFSYFTTTLTVSPHKDAQLLNEEGFKAAEAFEISFLPSDFKKKDGFKQSVALSKAYGLYRQDYCGCEFSLREAEKREAAALSGQKEP